MQKGALFLSHVSDPAHARTKNRFRAPGWRLEWQISHAQINPGHSQNFREKNQSRGARDSRPPGLDPRVIGPVRLCRHGKAGMGEPLPEPHCADQPSGERSMFGQAGFVGSSSRAWDWDLDDRKTKRVVAAATPAVDCCILAELEGCASHDGHIDVLEWPCLFMRLPASEERWQNRQSWIVMGMAEARQARRVEIVRSRIRGLKGCEADRFYVGGMRDSVRETNYQAPMKSCCDLAAANRSKQAGASRSGAPGFSKARTSVLMRDGGIRMGVLWYSFRPGSTAPDLRMFVAKEWRSAKQRGPL